MKLCCLRKKCKSDIFKLSAENLQNIMVFIFRKVSCNGNSLKYQSNLHQNNCSEDF